MKEAIGHVPLYTIIMIFIVITFGFLSATLTYYKAFKLNSRIAYQLEKFEGYNSESIAAINADLDSLGYRIGALSGECPTKNMNGYLKATYKMSNYPVCIYESSTGYSTSRASGYRDRYFKYGIVTYIYIDIPLIGGTFKLPVYTESERIFKYNA